MNPFDVFVNHCRIAPDLNCPLPDFVREYHNSLSVEEARKWPRGRVLAEIVKRGFPVGTVNKVATIGGLGLVRQAAWQVDASGELILG
jgi:hypothetical protein